MSREEKESVLIRGLIDLVEEISSISEYRNAYRKQLCNLSRRIKLLAPMFEELRESRDPIGDHGVEILARLRDALDSAKGLLRLGSEGSKIFLVLERDKMVKQFQEVAVQLEHALGGISFENYDISDEVREQVELVHAQFRRAKERVDTPDAELYNDLFSIYDRSSDAHADPALLSRLSEKLQLTSISDLKQESVALHQMVVANGGRDPRQNIEKMSMVLKKIKDHLQTQNPGVGPQANSKDVVSCSNLKIPVVPEDFRCPISLEMMHDPVIVATGQTYERRCIEKWLAGGHNTCPKTQQKLTNTSLTTNFVLRSLISQWCEANDVESPKRPSEPSKPVSACTPAEHANIEALIRKLSSPVPEDQRSAAGELRLLAKRNADNRICIAESGAIPILASLLSTADPRTQEHAVTALLNLSILEDNKASIVSSGAVPGIVHVIRTGSMEARENAAATLFSLSVVDEYKVTIGQSGAIPALVSLLNEGSQRGKKDAATALFNLCIYQGNKAKAVRAGVVPTLLELLAEPAGAMADEALVILAILSSHHEGKAAIGATHAVPMLSVVLATGSPRNRENAAAVLVNLCTGDSQRRHLVRLQEWGAMGSLIELAANGTERGRRKAAHLIERMNRFLENQEHAQANVQAQIELSTFLASSNFFDI